MAKHNWSRDELVLMCDAVAANQWKAFRANQHEARTLSEIMRALSTVPEADRDETFRSPQSIQRKSYDLVTSLSTYTRPPTKGGELTRKVVAQYELNAAKVHAEAQALRAVASAADIGGAADDLDEEVDEIEAPEGRAVLVAHYRRERNRKLRAAKIAHVLATGGQIDCDVCRFDFGAAYGAIGEGFIEVHHVLPLHVSGATMTRLEDLALLCSNCHRMIHRARPWLTPEELKVRHLMV